MRKEFGNPKELIHNNIDILLFSKTNNDYSFPTTQFCIDRYSSFCRMNNLFVFMN